MSDALPPSSVSSSTSVEATTAAHQRRALCSSLPPIASIKRFPEIDLTPEEQTHYDRVVGRLLYHAVQEYANYGSGGTMASATAKVDRRLWTQVRKDRDMNVYRSVNGSDGGAQGGPRVSLLLGLGKIEGSLEDVMDGLYSETSAELCTAVRVLTSRFIAGSVLHLSESRTPDDPFNLAGIKWVAIRTPGGTVTSDRDLLYYSRQGMTFDAEGNEVAYHLMQSVDRPEWPANAFRHLVRSHVSICYLYKRSKNHVQTFFWGEFYGSGATPQLILNYAAAGKWLGIKNALKVAEAKKLSQLKQQATAAFRASDRSITISDINDCYMCEERRSFFSSQQLCAGCHQNVCNSCSEEKKLFELDARGRPVRDRFCKKCLTHVAKQHGSKITWTTKADATELPPAYFDLAFHSAASGRTMLESMSSTRSLLTNGSIIDTSYMDESLELLDKESSGLEDPAWENYERRKRSHVDRLSSSSSYTRELFLSEIFEDLDVNR